MYVQLANVIVGNRHSTSYLLLDCLYCRFLNVCEHLSLCIGYIRCSWLFNFASVTFGDLFSYSAIYFMTYFHELKDTCKTQEMKT